ncbi:MAG: hypothetical protein ACK4MF_02925 [Hyphomicrobiaceae bacterium]
MTRDTAETIYGAVVGAILANAYIFGRAWWAGDAAAGFDADLIGATLAGAIAGAVAMALRRGSRG